MIRSQVERNQAVISKFTTIFTTSLFKFIHNNELPRNNSYLKSRQLTYGARLHIHNTTRNEMGNQTRIRSERYSGRNSFHCNGFGAPELPSQQGACGPVPHTTETSLVDAVTHAVTIFTPRADSSTSRPRARLTSINNDRSVSKRAANLRHTHFNSQHGILP